MQLSFLRWAANQAMLAATFRSLPMMLCMTGRRAIDSTFRITTLAIYALIILYLGTSALRILIETFIGISYYAGASFFVVWVRRHKAFSIGELPICAALLSFVIALVVPVALLRDAAIGGFLTIGWDFSLKTYSFLRDTRSAQADVRAALFFLVVDPTVVFTDRAQLDERGAQGITPTFGRWLLGVTSMCAGFLLAHYAQDLAGPTARTAGLSGAWSVCFLGATRFFATYFQHSGKASMQVGLMRALGYRIGERYDHPYRAANPMDFWRRWNIYTGNWVRRYLYTPAALFLVRHRKSRFVSRVAAGSAAFLAVGVYHDIYSFLEQGEMTLAMTSFFAISSSIVVGWYVLRAAIPHLPGARLLRVQIERTAFVVLFLVVAGTFY